MPEIGSTLLHYSIESRLGEGGMGTVYRARDTVLNRTVALKVLHAKSDTEMRRRLLHEARAASALNHPNSVTIHSVEQDGDVAFIVMEHVAGETLDRKIPQGGPSIGRALQYAHDITAAVAAAHAQGIVHRDLKPANVIVTPDGRVKVLDFGIARRTALPDEATRLQTVDATIAPQGTIAGTLGYIAPEQIAGQPATERSDIFALGVILFELLTGVSPFRRETIWATLDATMNQSPSAVSGLKPGIPAGLEDIITRCLAKDPSQRPASASDLLSELEEIQHAAAPPAAVSRERHVWFAAIAVVLAIGVAAPFAWMYVKERRSRWVRDTAIPEISRLIAAGDPVGAYRVALRARDLAPNDPQLTSRWSSFTQLRQIASDPPGADVSLRSLSGKDEWIRLGTTPLAIDVPLGQVRWRFTLAGYDALEIVANPFPSDVTLVRTGTAPPGMVRVPAGSFEQPRDLLRVTIPEYWIDRFEVTNKQFKEFIDRGGYRNPAYWREPMVKDGRTLGWEEAIAMFRDSTGQPGPATWELGSFPDGREDWPVDGVSWYEAAAYSRYAGKSLPTIYHWYRASGAFGIFSDVLSLSNFRAQGPERVGSSGALGPFGTFDMAGNVKEWTWNQSGSHGRYILGGAWNEAPYQFLDEDAKDPIERRAGFGFRCIKPVGNVPGNLMASIDTLERDPATLKSVSDEVFNAYRRLYDYDQRPLDARVDEKDDSDPYYVLERVSFSAAYGNERVPMMLFLPRGVRPPYQVLVYFPGSDAIRTQNSRSAYLQFLQFLPRSGRAVAFPVYQQTYERRRQSRGQNFMREFGIQRGMDVRRTIDYLESRAEIDVAKVSFYGMSLGAQLAPVYLVVEPRLRAGVLLSGGFETWTVPPETDPVNFAPRVTQPVLMVNGREDFDLPYETAQLPLFRMLGTKAESKEHVVLEGGHLPPRPQEVFKVILGWLDRQFGAVQR